ncbi:MAG TPA: F0F1 ATP synthase subunit A [Patescibacteria group bacterium]|nr:F0F1 ATP synthase subunit A [Patescibacteria group bacterium]
MAALTPDIIAQLGPIPITNTLVNTALVDTVIIAGVIAINKNIKKIPGILQNLFEIVVDWLYTITESVAGENTAKIFPYFFIFFIFILVANWSGLLPGSESIGFLHTTSGGTDIVSLNRNLTSDLNATFGLALVSLIATHMLSIQRLGIKEYLSRFFSLNPILLFVGLLEIVSEITKVISLSFRLFGNIFAGEVVLGTISKLFAFGFPVPFMFLEIIVGLVQALVFSMLTMAFMSVLMTPHHEENHVAKEVSSS